MCSYVTYNLVEDDAKQSFSFARVLKYLYTYIRNQKYRLSYYHHCEP